MKEPDVTLTDFAITLECFIFCALLFRRYRFQTLSREFILFFFAIGLAAFAGGIVHGFFYVHATTMHTVFWFMSMSSIGLMALSGWMIGIALLNFHSKISITLKILAGLNFVFYISYLLLVSQKFLVAIINYLPATIFLLGVFVYRYCKTAERPIIFGILAMLLTFASSVVQQVKISLHPIYFDHNAFYHLIQVIALFLLFVSANYFIKNLTVEQ